MTRGTAMTLREGLNRHYEENVAILSERQVSSEAKEFLRCHDVAHVVFGCNTSLFGEGILKLYTIFGTTLGFRKHLRAYAEADAFGLFRQYSTLHVLQNVLRLSVNIPRAIYIARSMSRPWPWSDHSEYLDESIQEIRKEFNIRVIPQ